MDEENETRDVWVKRKKDWEKQATLNKFKKKKD